MLDEWSVAGLHACETAVVLSCVSSQRQWKEPSSCCIRLSACMWAGLRHHGRRIYLKQVLQSPCRRTRHVKQATTDYTGPPLRRHPSIRAGAGRWHEAAGGRSDAGRRRRQQRRHTAPEPAAARRWRPREIRPTGKHLQAHGAMIVMQGTRPNEQKTAASCRQACSWKQAVSQL